MQEISLTSDILLVVFLPLAIAVVGLKWMPSIRWSEVRSLIFPWNRPPNYGPVSLEKAYESYLAYHQQSSVQVDKMKTSYRKMNRGHNRIGFTLGYPDKLAKYQGTLNENKNVTDGIARLAASEFPSRLGHKTLFSKNGPPDLPKVRESLKHFVRDWSEEGASERKTTFAPIVNLLSKEQRRADGRKPKVLVPGCGLGRLAWDVSELGFDVTAVEMSYFQILAFRYLLSAETTSKRNQHVVHPYSYWFSHQKGRDAVFRSVRFPDVVPRIQEGKLALIECDFLSLKSPESKANPEFWQSGVDTTNSKSSTGYNYVVTLFFIDTSDNIISTLQQIFSLLKPGGLWINLGPLLWPVRAQLQLSLEELLDLAKEIGFVFEPIKNGKPGEITKTVECEYTADKEAMMRWLYQAEFWTARKPA